MVDKSVPRKFHTIFKVEGTPIQTPRTLIEKWVFYSYALNKLLPLQFLLPITHMLGIHDAILRKWESEFFSKPPIPTESEMLKNNLKMYESYLWVLSAYEVVRTLSQKSDQNEGLFNASVTEKIRKTKHKLEEIRIPLAKLEPRRGNKGETALAIGGQFENSYGWIVEPGGKFYSRLELAEAVLELLKFMYESDQSGTQ